MSLRSFAYRHCQAKLIARQFFRPWSVVYDHKRNFLIISDPDNNCVRWVDNSTLKHLTFYGEKGTKSGELKQPRGLCIQPNTNHLLICDTSNRRIQVLSMDDDDASCFSITPRPLFTITNEFNINEGVCCAPDGRMFVTDYHTHWVHLLDCKGCPLKKFGNSNRSLLSPDGVVFVHPCFSPSSLASGMLCVADFLNKRVSVWDVCSSISPRHLFNFQVPGYATEFCVDLKGYLHVSCGDTYHSIEIFDLRMIRPKFNALAVIQTLGRSGKYFSNPAGMCVDSENNLIVADFSNNQIQIFDEKK